MPWKWNPLSNRYQDTDTGRFMKRSDIISLVDASIQSSGNVMDTLASMIAGEKVSPADWFSIMKSEIKKEYIRNYLAGIGGQGQMSPADWGRLGGMLSEQYKYLKGFRDVVANLTEAQIRAERARSRMYINSAREAFERATYQVVLNWGADEESWVVNPEAENCDDCLYLERQGWVPIGDLQLSGEKVFPGDGKTICITNCKCGKLYRRSESGEIYGQ